MRMQWADNQFMHWRVPARRLARLVPRPLGLDLWQDEAWVSLVALRAKHTRVGPLRVGNQDYAQVNLRTYVRHGGRHGIWLLATYVSDPLAAVGARLFGLPYRDTPVQVAPGTARIGAWLEASWQPAPAALAGVDAFLVERRSLFARVGSQLVRFDVEHEPWQLSGARGAVEVPDLLPRSLRRSPELAHVAAPVDVTFRRPGRARVA